MNDIEELTKKVDSIMECVEAWNTPKELKDDIAELSSKVEKLSGVPDDVRAINMLLTGNGDPPKGLVVRVDRLEQESGARKGIWNVITAAIISALVALGFRQVAP